MECGFDDCFACPYPDCIVDEYGKVKLIGVKKIGAPTKANKITKDIRKYNRDYYILNQEYLKDKQKEYAAVKRKERIISQQSTCFYCKKVNKNPHEVIKYHKYYFCCPECLGNYLYQRAEGKQEAIKIWFDERKI